MHNNDYVCIKKMIKKINVNHVGFWANIALRFAIW